MTSQKQIIDKTMTDLAPDEAEAYRVNANVFSGGMDRHDIKDYYSNWAGNYEKDLCPGRYNGPYIAAEVCSQCFYEEEVPTVTVLDIAAGTGFLGNELLQRGFRNIHALEPSEQMLEIAKAKEIYTKVYNEFMTEDKLPINEDTYDCVTSSGGMGDGHIPAEAIKEMIRITKPGGYIIIVMREEYMFDVPGYKDKLQPLIDKLEEQGKWRKVNRIIVPNYAFGKEGLVLKYQKL